MPLEDTELGLDEEFGLVDQIEIEAKANVSERRQRAEAVLRQRKISYGRIFIDGGATADDMKIVLEDLSWFCREKRSTFDPNTHMAARLDGRREVILRIREYLDLSVPELMQSKFQET